MPDFCKVAYPVFSPTHCATCWSNRCPDGFVDMLCEVPVFGWNEDGTPGVPPGGEWPVFGRFYQCAWCIRQAAKLVGCAVPETVAKLVEELVEARARAAAFEVELSEMRERPLSLDAQATLEYIAQHRPGPKPKVTA